MSVFAALALFFQAIWSSIIGLFTSSKWSVNNQPADIEAAIPAHIVEIKELTPVPSLPVNNLVEAIDNLSRDKDSKNLGEGDSKDESEEKAWDTRISSNSSNSRYQPTRRQSLLLENIRKYAEDDTYDSDNEYDVIESVVISPEPEFVVTVSGQEDKDCNVEAKRGENDSSLTCYPSPLSVSSKPSSLRSPKSASGRNRDRHVQFEETPSKVQFTPLPERVSRKHREKRESQRIEMYDYLARVSDAQAQVPPHPGFALSQSESIESIASDVSTASCYSQNSDTGDDDSDSNETGGTSMPSTPEPMHRQHAKFPDLTLCDESDSDARGENDLLPGTPESSGSVLCDPLPEVPIQEMKIGAGTVTATHASESSCDIKGDVESTLLDTAKAHAREETLRKLLSSGSPPSSSSRSPCIMPEPPLLLPACLFPVVEKPTTTTPAPDVTIPPLKIVKKSKIVVAPVAEEEEALAGLQVVETKEGRDSCDKVAAELLDKAAKIDEDVTPENSADTAVGMGCSNTSNVNGPVGVSTNPPSQTFLAEKRKRTAGLQPKVVVVPEGYF